MEPIFVQKKSPILSEVQKFLPQIVQSSSSSYATATAFLFLHGVTDTTHGFNIAFLTFYIKLATQITNIDIHDIGLCRTFILPDTFQQLLTSQNFLASHKSGQKVILTTGQSNHLLATINGMMFYIHTQISVRRWNLHLTTVLIDKVPTSENR